MGSEDTEGDTEDSGVATEGEEAEGGVGSDDKDDSGVSISALLLLFSSSSLTAIFSALRLSLSACSFSLSFRPLFESPSMRLT